MAATVEKHYDGKASQYSSRAAALAVRNSGALIQYKRHANGVKRRMIEQYAGGAALLVDLGCGRGGDIGKWRDARVQRVVALDLSAKQLDEAKRRACDGSAAARAATAIEWHHGSMLDPSLLARLDLRGAADAVTTQFAQQYAFSSEACASRTLGAASSLLRPGGVMFGLSLIHI